jgi:glucokinase
MNLGIDIGGTNLKYGVLNSRNEFVSQNTQPTNAAKGKNYLITLILKIIKNHLDKYATINSIGIGLPGIVNPGGYVYIAPNLPGWNDIPLGDIIREEIGEEIPLTFDNDSNTAAYAEMKIGAGVGLSHFIYVTLGTGVGGTIIANNQIFRGEFGGAGEIGHLIINAFERLNKGKPFRTGILEEYVGKNQITEYAVKYLKTQPNSLLNYYERPDPYFITDAIKKHDTAASDIFKNIGYILGIGLSSVVNLLDIKTIIVGGGLSQSHPVFFEAALQTIRDRALPSIADRVEIVPAKYSKDAGVIGAALMSKELFLKTTNQ